MGAHGSAAAGLFDCQASFVSGALFCHGFGSFGGGFDSHGSFDCDALDATFPLPFAAAALFCSQPSFDDPDATDGEWVRGIHVSLLAPASDDGIGCLDIAPVFDDCQGSVAGDERPHGSGPCVKNKQKCI